MAVNAASLQPSGVRDLAYGAAQFASKLIGEREIVREDISRSRRPNEWRSTKTASEHHVRESAVLASEIEQLPDVHGYLKFVSLPN
jgi:Type IV secretion-system coupling protein DNA-binding domain